MTATAQNIPSVAAVLITAAVKDLRSGDIRGALSSLEEVAKTLAEHAASGQSQYAQDAQDLDWLDRHVTVDSVIDGFSGECTFRLILEDPEERITEFAKNAPDDGPFGMPIREIIAVARKAAEPS